MPARQPSRNTCPQWQWNSPVSAPSEMGWGCTVATGNYPPRCRSAFPLSWVQARAQVLTLYEPPPRTTRCRGVSFTEPSICRRSPLRQFAAAVLVVAAAPEAEPPERPEAERPSSSNACTPSTHRFLLYRPWRGPGFVWRERLASRIARSFALCLTLRSTLSARAPPYGDPVRVDPRGASNARYE